MARKVQGPGSSSQSVKIFTIFYNKYTDEFPDCAQEILIKLIFMCLGF